MNATALGDVDEMPARSKAFPALVEVADMGHGLAEAEELFWVTDPHNHLA